MKTCVVCNLRIYPGQRYHKAEFGIVHTSKKSGRDITAPHSEDLIHYECLPDYRCDPKYESYDAIMERAKEQAQQDLTEEMKEEMRAEIWDEVVDEAGKFCATCRSELREMVAEDEPGYPQQNGYHQNQPIAPLPTTPFVLPHLKWGGS